ncbi:helix-turn-helix transcriptional regulator [Oscillospiraceae bacterium 50-60]
MENRFKKARTDHNQHGPQSTKEVAQATGITKSLIEDIESTAGTPRNVGYLTVKKLAKYYGVSSDYLLGLSETPSIDEDIQVACKVTGLSEKAISRLHEVSERIKSHPSGLIPNPYDVLLTFDGSKVILQPEGEKVSSSEAFWVQVSEYLHERVTEVGADMIANLDDEDNAQLYSLSEQLAVVGYTVVPKQVVTDSMLQKACDILKSLFQEYGDILKEENNGKH